MVADQSRKGPMFADVICRRLSAAEKVPLALTLSPTRPSTALPVPPSTLFCGYGMVNHARPVLGYTWGI